MRPSAFPRKSYHHKQAATYRNKKQFYILHSAVFCEEEVNHWNQRTIWRMQISEPLTLPPQRSKRNKKRKEVGFILITSFFECCNTEHALNLSQRDNRNDRFLSLGSTHLYQTANILKMSPEGSMLVFYLKVSSLLISDRGKVMGLVPHTSNKNGRGRANGTERKDTWFHISPASINRQLADGG